jgi:hypothetical protein
MKTTSSHAVHCAIVAFALVSVAPQQGWAPGGGGVPPVTGSICVDTENESDWVSVLGKRETCRPIRGFADSWALRLAEMPQSEADRIVSISAERMSDLDILWRFPHLRTLSIRRLNDVELAPIAQIRTLEELHLRAEDLARGAAYVAKLRQLRRLTVTGDSALDPDTARRLSEAIPGLEIDKL